ncbi:aquaporin-10 [Aplysia californica]|uniref:Aquaporin-10 n=1 Tax=Aplysia californica TaxID=6500 RepID=A0ABM1A8Q9_APLCA|nr:aquaporin-10 [Aplysia californica]
MAGLEKSSWSRALRIRNQTVREMLSEMLGTFVLTLFSVAAGAQYTLSHQQNASFLALNVANGFGVTLAIYSCGGVSGGCVNPAISLTMCLTGRLPWKRYPFHVIGQICGAFIAACLVYGVYHEAIDMYDGGNRYVTGKEATAGIFCFFPQDYLSAEGGFLDSIVGTGMLVLSSLAVIDTRNMNPSPGFSAFPVGVAVMVIGNTFGMNSGYPINPARDLGPRIFITIAGWGREAFR